MVSLRTNYFIFIGYLRGVGVGCIRHWETYIEYNPTKSLWTRNELCQGSPYDLADKLAATLTSSFQSIQADIHAASRIPLAVGKSSK